MVEITQEENPNLEKLRICTVVAVFASLGKTLLQFRLSSRLTHFAIWHSFKDLMFSFCIVFPSSWKFACLWKMKTTFRLWIERTTAHKPKKQSHKQLAYLDQYLLLWTSWTQRWGWSRSLTSMRWRWRRTTGWLVNSFRCLFFFCIVKF